MPASHNAAFIEIASKGQADKINIAEPNEEIQQTFWRHLHEKHCPFALEPVEFDTTASQPRFNGAAKFQFSRSGDLCWHMYMHFHLPGLVGIKDGKVMRGADAPYWHPAIGYRLLRHVTLAIGGLVIDHLTDVFMYVWHQMTHAAGKELREMVGDFDTIEEQQAWSKHSQHLWVPLPFSMTRSAKLALPVVSLSFHQMFVEVQYCSRAEAIINPQGAQIFVRPDGMTDDEIEAGLDGTAGNRGRSLSLLQDADLVAVVEANYVYLENDERNKFSKGVFSQLTDELQIIQTQAFYAAAGANANSTAVKVNAKLGFNNVIKEVITVVRPEGRENAFDFSGPVDPASGTVLDPIKEISIRFNNTPRVNAKPAQYYRLVQPWQYHSRVPTDHGPKKQFFYVWSYSMDPEDPLDPKGGANHSRLENPNNDYALNPLIFSPERPNAEIINFGRGSNLLTYKFGMIHKKLG